MKVTLIGIGMGTPDTLTIEADRAIRAADVLIGAKRMLAPFLPAPGSTSFSEENTVTGTESMFGERDAAPDTSSDRELYTDAAPDTGSEFGTCGKKKKYLTAYDPDEIIAYINSLPDGTRAAVLLSGDTGFYSGARRLSERLPADTEVICGISSMPYFCSRLKTTWEDVCPISLHGRNCNVVGLLKEHPRLFAIAGSAGAVQDVCIKLCEYGMGDTRVSVGERLSYPDERILTGQAKDFTLCAVDRLSVMLLERPDFSSSPDHCGSIPDDAFIRGHVPMTKEEVRCISISKLHLKRDSIVYDIGAGTGSVSVEAARIAVLGRVYAIEPKDEAFWLLGENRREFAVDNMVIEKGTAPETLINLPPPDCAFIGGSGGNLREILECLHAKNPSIRVVMNVISPETLSQALLAFRDLPFSEPEIISVSIAKARAAGSHHLMIGQNPVCILSAEGKRNS